MPMKIKNFWHEKKKKKKKTPRTRRLLGLRSDELPGEGHPER